MGPLDLVEEVEGILYETLFLQVLAAINDYLKTGYKIYYWRTSSNTEVDFILYGPNGLKAFEVKRKGKISSKDLKGLNTFRTDYPEAEAYCIYGGQRELSSGKIRIILVKYALKNMDKIL